MRSFTVLLILLPLFACTRSGSTDPGGIVRDSAGIRLIELPSIPYQDPEVELVIDPTWSPAGNLEIGTLSDVAPGPGGRVLLLDGMAADITVLTPSGGVETVLGRPGEGPGEFSARGLLRDLVTTDSSVIVPDTDLQRATEFALDGKVLGIEAYPFPAYAVNWRSHPDGGFAFQALDPGGDVLFHWAEGVVDTLFAFSHSDPNSNPNALLPPVALWDLDPAGHMAVGWSDDGVVELWEEGAEAPIWRARRADVGGGLTDDDRVHLRNLIIESIRRYTNEVSQEVVASIEYPHRRPVMAGILAAPNGDVWVCSAQPVRSMGLEALRIGSAEGYAGLIWDVLTPEGRLRTRVGLPSGFVPRRFVGEWIYGVLADNLGVQTVARVKVLFP